MASNYKLLGIIAGLGALYYFTRPKEAKAAEKPKHPPKPEEDKKEEDKLPGKEEPEEDNKLDDLPPPPNGDEDKPYDQPEPQDDVSYLGNGLVTWNNKDIVPDLETIGKFLQAFGYLTDYKFCIQNGQWINNEACKAYTKQFQKDYNDVILIATY